MRLSLELVKRAVHLYRQGMALPDIARECNISEAQSARLITGVKVITQRTSRQEDSKTVIGEVEEGKTVEEIAEATKLPVSEVAALARHAQKRGQVGEVSTSSMNRRLQLSAVDSRMPPSSRRP